MVKKKIDTAEMYHLIEGLVDVLVDKNLITEEEYEKAVLARFEKSKGLTKFEELEE